MTDIDLDHVRAALALADFDVAAAQRRMAPQPRPLRRGDQRDGAPRRAGVLVLLYPAGEGLALALMHRTANPNDVHSGQISLPGGAQEPGETAIQTALRETREELGVTGPVEILGNLTCLYIPPSDYEVRPVVGYVLEHPVWRPDPTEVAEVLDFPLAWLVDDGHKVTEAWEFGGLTMDVPWYDVSGHKVWGATAIMLSEFEQRLRQVVGR